MAQLGLAWTLKNPNVSTTICGASRPEQMEQNLKVLEIVPKLTPEVMQEMGACHLIAVSKFHRGGPFRQP